jgi:hypothetical protein
MNAEWPTARVEMEDQPRPPGYRDRSAERALSLMAALVHEIWETTEDEMVLHTCCMAGSRGAACRETLPSNSRLLITFVAGCHFDAMTIYNLFLGREPYASEHGDDYHAYPEEWLDVQRSVDALTVVRFGEFTNQWFELCIVNDGLIRSLVAQRDPDDNNPEHLRYAAFQHFVAANRPLANDLCWRLYDLGCADVDLAMGGAMMADVLRLVECPIDLLTEALSSNRKHVARIAARRLDAEPQNATNKPMNPSGGSGVS